MSKYNKVARELGVKLHLGRYGLTFLNRDPSGKIYKLVSIVRLDGWTFDQTEVLQAMVDDGWRINYKKGKK